MMANELVVHQADQTLSVAEIKANADVIRRVMKDGMEKDKDYGTIPGCGKKPTLLKPGSEKILSTFKIAVNPVVEDISGPDEARYRVTANGVSMQTGAFLGAGIGEAGTNEEKYKWRKAVCNEEWDATPETRRRLAFKKKYQSSEYEQVKQVRTNPADLANTVLKMAKKRAQIDMTLTVTAASDVFSQDIDDLSKELREVVSEPSIQEPKRKSEMGDLANTVSKMANKRAQSDVIDAATSSEGELTVQAVPDFYKAKDGNKPHSVKLNGDWYTTFSDTDGATLQEAKELGQLVTVEYVMKGDYRNITGIPEPPADPVTPVGQMADPNAEAEPLPEYQG